MKKIGSKVVSLCLIVVMMMSLLTACGSSVSNDAMDSLSGYDSVSNGSGLLGNISSGSSKSEYGESDGVDLETESLDSSRKIIERINMSVETKTFDELMGKLETRLDEVGGYVESSTVYGNGYYHTYNRSATLVLRVPSDKSDLFIGFVSTNSTVTRKDIRTEDVTLEYVDIESRIAALEIQKATMERLLAEAESMSDVLMIQDELTNVIYQLESAASQLRTYDNLIDYTTVTLNIEEVETTTVVAEQTVWEEIVTKFNANIKELKDDAVDLFVWVVSESPYLIIGAMCIAVIVFVLKRISKLQKEKQQAFVNNETTNVITEADVNTEDNS